MEIRSGKGIKSWIGDRATSWQALIADPQFQPSTDIPVPLNLLIERGRVHMSFLKLLGEGKFILSNNTLDIHYWRLVSFSFSTRTSKLFLNFYHQDI